MKPAFALIAFGLCSQALLGWTATSVQAQLIADFAAPGSARIEQSDARLGPADGDGFAPVHFQPSNQPSVQLNAPSDGWNWSGASAVQMHLQNAMAWPVTVQIRLLDQAGGSLDATLGLPPGGPLTLSVPLRATQPRRWGMTAGPPVPWLQEGTHKAVALTTSGHVDQSRIAAIRIAMVRPDAEQTLRIGKAFLDPAHDPERLAYTSIVDGFGQYTLGTWPEKFKSGGADFATFVRSFDSAAANPAQHEGGHDPYGGLKRSSQRDRGDYRATGPSGASGFFKTALLPTADGNSRWVLITPEGNPFFSIGVNAVQSANSQTFVHGREFMFTALPRDGTPLARFYGAQDSADDLPANAGAQRGRGFGKGRTFDFYRANLFRRDGADFERQWLQRTRERLLRWRFNTVGSWSDVAVSDNSVEDSARIPYTRTLHVAGNFGKLSDGNDWWSGIADPFDPRFSQALESAVASGTRSTRSDPWLIGYFVDNELGWGDGAATDPRTRYGLAYSALRAGGSEGARGGEGGDEVSGEGAHAKRALIQLLKYRHDGSIERLSTAWKSRYASWDDLQAPLATEQLPDGAIPAVAADLSAFLELHAQRYFEQVAAALKRHDPDHLYLGARFSSRTPEALAACARWCDVVSFNLYLPSIDSGFESTAFHRLGKPALLTEFHFASNDRGPFWNGVMAVPHEADRGPAYARMLQSVLANPDFVGAHWFQYLDQPVTGRWLDGENGHLGLVAITDIPWTEFVEQAGEANRTAQKTLRKRLGGL